MSNKISEHNQDGFFEVTEADYQDQLAEGIEEEFVLKPGRYKFFRGRHPNFRAGDLESRNTIVHVSVPLTLDVLKYFERRAAELNADSYLTLMADALREVMENSATEDRKTHPTPERDRPAQAA